MNAVFSLTLTAPHDGIVVLERDWRGDPPRVGDTCWAGEKIGEIPDLAAMEAEMLSTSAITSAMAWMVGSLPSASSFLRTRGNWK